MKRYLLLLLLPLFTLCANAFYVKIDGIEYDLDLNSKVAVVSDGSPSGDFIIPETVTYEGEKYTVTSINIAAFRSCSDLTSVTIPNSVTYIGFAAFAQCSALTSVIIPNSVTTIVELAFGECSALTSVTIPNSITSIDAFVFWQSGLTSVTIPNSVTTIDLSAFASCKNLTDVYCLAENVPQTSSSAFSWTPIDQATLHVPEQSIDAYKAVFPWSGFKNIVGDATGINRIHSNSVQVQQENGHITVEGGEDGTVVSVYDIKGVQIGSSIVEGGQVSIPNNLQTGSIAIVKIKDKSIKINIK